MKNLLITLLSDQTIPNVQFIKFIQKKLENEHKEYEHLFVLTETMKAKGVGEWICKVCNISNPQIVPVEHNSLSDIETKLKSVSADYEMFFVNVTGGTKIMSMGVSDFFKQKTNARIYYIDGNKCWLNFPEKDRWCDILSDNINLQEYIESYGFGMKGGEPGIISFDYTKQFLQTFMNFDVDSNELKIIKTLQTRRGEKKLKINEIDGLQSFLENIKFPVIDNTYKSIEKKEIKYLTGDWFEEYIYFRLKEENIIEGNNLKTGVHLIKNNVDNEFDNIFLYKTKFYAIECKTSILSGKGNIINETIYKSTALQKNLGLFSNFSIFTLSSHKSNDIKSIHLNRATDLKIKIFCREDIMESDSISKLLELC